MNASVDEILAELETEQTNLHAQNAELAYQLAEVSCKHKPEAGTCFCTCRFNPSMHSAGQEAKS